MSHVAAILGSIKSSADLSREINQEVREWYWIIWAKPVFFVFLISKDFLVKHAARF